MTPSEADSLHQSPRLVCSYCGNEEALPADAMERHRHLRFRLIQLQREREGNEAPIRTFRQIGEVYVFGVVIAAALASWQIWNLVGLARGNVALGFDQLIVPVMSAAPMVGLITGWIGMRRAFARMIEPLLRARAPVAAGLAARCRCCGGDLPLVRAPQVVCQYCGASNLLDGQLTAAAGELLAAEADEYRRRAQGWHRDASVYSAPARMFYRWGAIGAAAAAGAGIVVATLLI